MIAAILMGNGAFAVNAVEDGNAAVMFAEEARTDFIKAALEAGIIENSEQKLDEEISREQFCEFAYNMLNKVKELPAAKLSRNPFDDVNNYKINALAFVGIVSGKGENVFAPNDKISREEAAVIFCRIAKYAEAELPIAKVDMSYSDNVQISDWAVSSVYSLKLSGVMENSSGEAFNPAAAYTVEETVASLLRLRDIIKK